MKKHIIKYVILILALFLPSCSLKEIGDINVDKPLLVYETKDFQYILKEEEGVLKGYIVGLTASGKQKKNLVLSDTIDTVEIFGLGYRQEVVESLALEKCYFNVKPNWKLMENSCFNAPNASMLFWTNLDYKIGNCKRKIYGYNLYCSTKLSYDSNPYLGNVVYLFNYPDAPNGNYYWIDSYDLDLISFIPPTPVRSGYTFEGWYKEEECKNIWNFNLDITGKELPISEGVTYDYSRITFLYAKWIENSSSA